MSQSAPGERKIPHQALLRRHILVVEDEPLIALDIEQAFEAAGATVFIRKNIIDAMATVRANHIDGATLDFGQAAADSNALCNLLDLHHTPYVLHSGHDSQNSSQSKGRVIPKPASPKALVDAIASMLD